MNPVTVSAITGGPRIRSAIHPAATLVPRVTRAGVLGQVPAREFGTAGWPNPRHPTGRIFAWAAVQGERTAVIRLTSGFYGEHWDLVHR